MESEKFFVYILQSMKDFSFYVGQCNDLDRRMSKHTEGLSKYTASKRPWKLVYFEMLESRSAAILREKQIKNQKSRRYIEILFCTKEIMANNAQKIYTYNGDRRTDPKYRGKTFVAVLNQNGKCIRGRNGNMLVTTGKIKVVVLARQLRKLSKGTSD